MKKSPGGLVYSTDRGRLCPGCHRPVASCVCKDHSRPATGSNQRGDGIVRLRRETKGRKGAGVTIVDGLPLPLDELESLARKLKSQCGVGGAVKGGTIELQGEQRSRVQPILEAMGLKVKIAGG